MNKKQKYISILIILITIGIFLNRNIIFLNKITIDNLSIQTIVKGYETNIFDNGIAIEVNGDGFKSGDRVLVNGKEADTVVVKDEYLTFILKKELYLSADNLIIEVSRFTPKNNIILKSNNKIIKVFSPREIVDNDIIINEILPSNIEINENKDIAISILGKGFSKEDKIYINGEEQTTTFGNPNLLTCMVSVKNCDDIKKTDVMVKNYRELYKGGKILISNKKYIYIRWEKK